MKVSWRELQETPAHVVEDFLLVMAAEAKDAKRRNDDMQRKMRRR